MMLREHIIEGITKRTLSTAIPFTAELILRELVRLLGAFLMASYAGVDYS